MRACFSLAAALLGCGPNVGVATSGATASTTSTTAGPAEAGDASTSGGASESDSTQAGTGATGAATTTGSSGSGSESGSTGAATCPPRTLPEAEGVWWRVFVNGRSVYPAPAEASCNFGSAASTPEGGTEISFACTFGDDTFGLMVLQSAVELDPLPLDPDAEVVWSRETMECCQEAERHVMILREANGALVFGVFLGWDPDTPADANALDPINVALVRDVCEPCTTLGCVPRGALGVSVADSEVVRIFDGNTEDVGEEPAFRVTVVSADDGANGIGAPDSHASIVFVRLP